jgi:glucokinase
MPLPFSSTLNLVGDVGGTNCRLALTMPGEGGPRVIEPRNLKCAEFEGVEQAIGAYLRDLGLKGDLGGAVIAVAGPVQDGVASSTNNHWRLAERSLRDYGFATAALINDYTAFALCVEHLTSSDVAVIGPDVVADPDASMAVLGAGTGFGASALAKGLGGKTPISTEAGHASFAATDEVEAAVLDILSARYGRVSIERILSGPGLFNLFGALSQLRGGRCRSLTPEEIVNAARAGDAIAKEAVDRFCAIYGAVAGDIALTLGARGGVFLGGGIAPELLPELRSGAFRRQFEAKGRFQAYMAAIPTRVIVHPYAALVGAASMITGALERQTA